MPTIKERLLLALENPILRERRFQLFLTVGALVNIGLYVVVALVFDDSQEFLISYYSVNTALVEDSVPNALMLLPAIGTMLLVVNAIVAATLVKRKKSIATIILGVTIALQLFLLIDIIALRNINTFQ